MLIDIRKNRKERVSFCSYISYHLFLDKIHNDMVSLGYDYVLLLLLLSLLITTQIDVTLSSCEPDTVGTCGCCKKFTTECVIIPSNIIPSFESYEEYICVPKLSAPNFSLNHCNCTSKEPSFCICPNQHPKIYPVYSTCYSFTECIIHDIKVNSQQKIRGKTVIPSYLLFHYVFSFLFCRESLY